MLGIELGPSVGVFDGAILFVGQILGSKLGGGLGFKLGLELISTVGIEVGFKLSP